MMAKFGSFGKTSLGVGWQEMVKIVKSSPERQAGLITCHRQEGGGEHGCRPLCYSSSVYGGGPQYMLHSQTYTLTASEPDLHSGC